MTETSEGLQHIISATDQFLDSEIFDILLANILSYSLHHYLIDFEREVLNTLLQRYSDNVLLRNLNKSLNEINLKDIKLPHHAPWFSTIFELEHYSVLLRKVDRDMQLLFWSRSYDEMFCHSFSLTDISRYFESLKSRFSESDIEIIGRYIYFILGPQEGADTENTTRFIGSYESGTLYDFFGWEGFPLANISSNPSILSKIIVEHEQRYTDTDKISEEIKKRINLEEFGNEHVRPPAKLLAYHLLNEPYDQKVLEESIEYFRSCSSEEKKGTFSILYKLLNPFGLA